MSVRRRLAQLEARILPRCFRCGRELACSACETGIDLHTMSNAELVEFVAADYEQCLQWVLDGVFRRLSCTPDQQTVLRQEAAARTRDYLSRTTAENVPQRRASRVSVF